MSGFSKPQALSGQSEATSVGVVGAKKVRKFDAIEMVAPAALPHVLYCPNPPFEAWELGHACQKFSKLFT